VRSHLTLPPLAVRSIDLPAPGDTLLLVRGEPLVSAVGEHKIDDCEREIDDCEREINDFDEA
jgi:hypothetical protein